MLGSDNPPGDGELYVAEDVGGALTGGAAHLTLCLQIVDNVKVLCGKPFLDFTIFNLFYFLPDKI